MSGLGIALKIIDFAANSTFVVEQFNNAKDWLVSWPAFAAFLVIGFALITLGYRQAYQRATQEKPPTFPQSLTATFREAAFSLNVPTPMIQFQFLIPGIPPGHTAWMNGKNLGFPGIQGLGSPAVSWRARFQTGESTNPGAQNVVVLLDYPLTLEVACFLSQRDPDYVPDERDARATFHFPSVSIGYQSTEHVERDTEYGTLVLQPDVEVKVHHAPNRWMKYRKASQALGDLWIV